MLSLAFIAWISLFTPARPGIVTLFHIHLPTDPTHVHAHSHAVPAFQELDVLSDSPWEQFLAGDYLPAVIPITYAIVRLAVLIRRSARHAMTVAGWCASALSPPPRMFS